MTSRTQQSIHAGSPLRRLTLALGGRERTRVVLVLACVLGLSGADIATVGAAATELRHALRINNTDVGLLVTVTSLVASAATLPFGVLADRVKRTWTLGSAVALWGLVMCWSAAATSFDTLLVSRIALGVVTAAAGPVVASLVGDYFPAAERGKVYGFILTGELIGAGFGFAVTGGVAAISWRAAFVALGLPAFALAWFVTRLNEPERGSQRPPAHGRTNEAGRADAHRLALENGIEVDEPVVRALTARRMNFIAALRNVLRVRTNVILIVSSACAYYFLAGVETFGLEFAKAQYRIGQALATLVLLVAGMGSVFGALSGGAIGDALLRARVVNGRIITSATTVAAAVVLFIPPLLTRSLAAAMLPLAAAGFALSAQNAPLDAARLDIMPSTLWGRAEAVRTFLRSIAQALAPLVFGAVSDYVFGGGRSGLRWTFMLMLIPLGVSSALLWTALKTYPHDVAAAAASEARRQSEEPTRNEEA